MLIPPARKFSALVLLNMLALVFPVYSIPTTINFEGSVPYWGVDPNFTAPAVAVGDAFSGSVTYDSDALETGSFPDMASFYRDAILGLTINFQTSGGSITYATDATVNPLVINQVAVWNSRLSFEVTDFDFNGAQPPVTGPSEAGEYNGNPIIFQPIFVRFEASDDFSEYVNSHILPTPSTFMDADSFMVSVSFQGRTSPNSSLSAWYYGVVDTIYRDEQQPVIPEPATALLIGLGLLSWCCSAQRRRN
ncbi:MAG: PEP-CTERM sorting domain-containing protein [bacterium]|nr:PEP-CTERM sorting domain-containing protein [bacterium]